MVGQDQGGGLWLHAEFSGEHVHAGFKLAQGPCTLAAGGQQPHQLPVHILVPRIQFEQPLRPACALRVVALLGVVAHEPRQCLSCQVLASLTLHDKPGLELRAAVQGESRQKRAAIKGRGLFTGRKAAGRAPGQERLKAGHVDKGGAVRQAGGVKLQGMLGNEEARLHRVMVADGRAQVGQCMAQVGERHPLRPLRPQQFRQ